MVVRKTRVEILCFVRACGRELDFKKKPAYGHETSLSWRAGVFRQKTFGPPKLSAPICDLCVNKYSLMLLLWCAML